MRRNVPGGLAGGRVEKVLITGGAGFIGRFVADELLRRGNSVRVLDSLIEQVHGATDGSKMLNPEAELIRADVRDKAAVSAALQGVDSVIHLAAEVGVGQSMYEVERYTSTNDVGTAVLFEALIDRPVRRVVTASSMSIYGEGLYRDADGALVQDAERKGLRDGLTNWEPVDAAGRPLTPVATPEWKRPALSSIYALNKYVQERTTHIMAAPYGMEGVCLRLFNVYGPGQALSNPYTGVLAIFASRLLNGQQPMIFEDGEQRRDFVHVTDVARAFADALVLPKAVGGTFNIGSGHDRSVTEVATELARAMGKNSLTPEIVGKARIGDIRHCFCDTSLAADQLDFRATQDFQQGLAELAEWVARQTAQDRVAEMRAELEARGLVA
jgi:dTDP-L-rhamnose 4-epimerase